jgi:hypothetical protein
VVPGKSLAAWSISAIWTSMIDDLGIDVNIAASIIGSSMDH